MNKLRSAAVLLLTVFFFVTCDMDMGLGPSIDLEAPSLTVKEILLPDGSIIPIETEGSKLFIGPGILVGNGFVLRGTARDNVGVEEVMVNKTGGTAGVSRSSWSTGRMASPVRMGGEQEWALVLEGIEKSGTMTITITAHDRGKNIGPETEKHLTLLVDIEPPFVKSIEIERQQGRRVNLLSRSTLQGFDPDTFIYVNYFQNEQFRIRAEIEHDFRVVDVKLNLIDENGMTIFKEWLERESGTEYAPVWFIDHNMMKAANAKYDTGRHYLNVVITAKAEAGHSGSNKEQVTNLLASLCWYPEADKPRIQMNAPTVGGWVTVPIGTILSALVFDDDILDSVYYALVPNAVWNGFTPNGITGDAEKLEYLTNSSNRLDLKDSAGNSLLTNNELTSNMESIEIPIEVGDIRGDFRLVLLTRDYKDGRPAAWGSYAIPVRVTEEGIPIITVESPAENTAPALNASNEFTISGTVLNINAVRELKIAWVAAGLPTDISQEERAKAAILSGTVGTISNGIWVRNITMGPATLKDIGGKSFMERTFSITLNVLNNFTYNGQRENAIKYFLLYTPLESDPDNLVFETLRLLPYNNPPEIDVRTPDSFQVFSPGATVNFDIRVSSNQSVPIASLTMRDEEYPNAAQFLTRGTGTNINRWTGNGNRWATLGKDYKFEITATDILGNTSSRDHYIKVDSPPDLEYLSAPYEVSDTDFSTWFSSNDTVTIEAHFNRPVSKVESTGVLTDNGGTPRIVIQAGSFTNNTTRYAYYDSGMGSDTLLFKYKVPAGDRTVDAGITAYTLQLNGGKISASHFEGANSAVTSYSIPAGNRPANALPGRKKLNVDGVAPQIIAANAQDNNRITISVADYDSDYFNPATPGNGWIRAGATVTVKVTVNKLVNVDGVPMLNLRFRNEAGTGYVTQYAAYQTKTDTANQSTLEFTYKIKANDLAVPIVVTPTACFSATDRQMITDRIGANGNFFAFSPTGTAEYTGSNTTQVRVDAVPPGQLTVTTVGTPGTSETFEVTANPGPREGPIGEYTLNGGTSWVRLPNNWTTVQNSRQFTIQLNSVYQINARQIDRAGNVSPLGASVDRDNSVNCDLVSVICENSNGAYPLNSTLTFKLIFSGKVITQGGRPSIVLRGGTGPTNGNVTLTYPATITGAGLDILEFTLPITAANNMNNRIMDPVEVISINGLTNLVSALNAAVQPENKITPVGGDYLKRPLLKVLSVAPYVTRIDNNGKHVDVTATAQNTGDFVVEPSGANSEITLTFSHPVWAEKGNIIIRPAAGWYIPPVLTNAEFGSFTTAQQTTLETYYKQTTHGLKLNTAGTAWVPDTATKYVLNFAEGITATTGNTNTIRTTLDNAEYLWETIEVVNTDKVTFNGDHTAVTIKFDKLADGRRWNLVMDSGAFRDEAGNQFAGWARNASTTNFQRTFWSEKVAAPVVRINRVSNNRARDTQALRDNPLAILQTNVQYRIDCVTPDAVIERRTYNAGTGTDADRGTDGGIATINNTMTSRATYNASVTDGLQNSDIPDAPSTALNPAQNTINTATTQGTAYTIGDTSLYTARKDYIMARAIKTTATANNPVLSSSDTAREGAFKTVIVYRRPADRRAIGSAYVKTEGVDQLNAPPKIAGFPMTANDMTGAGSRHAYNNPDDTNDWIWITWEIVSEFWHVGMAVESDLPGAKLHDDTQGFGGHANSWEPFERDWYAWNYRKYGNWGLRVGDRN